jgi:hypothetical protein
MKDSTSFIVTLYTRNNGEHIITKRCELSSSHKEIYIYSSDITELPKDKQTYDYEEFMLSIPTSIKKIYINLLYRYDYLSFIPPHIEKLSIRTYYINEEKELCLQPLNNLPYGLKEIKIDYFHIKDKHAYSAEFRITTTEHLPSGYKYIHLSQFIKLPFGCILKLNSIGDLDPICTSNLDEDNGKRTFSNIDNIVIVFISVFDKRILPRPESN